MVVKNGCSYDYHTWSRWVVIIFLVVLLIIVVVVGAVEQQVVAAWAAVVRWVVQEAEALQVRRAAPVDRLGSVDAAGVDQLWLGVGAAHVQPRLGRHPRRHRLHRRLLQRQLRTRHLQAFGRRRRSGPVRAGSAALQNKPTSFPGRVLWEATEPG